jgi:2-methoxy-6-polyprenyl-1,4-benzoquinol methylase
MIIKNILLRNLTNKNIILVRNIYKCNFNFQSITENKVTHFGFETVKSAEKESKVHKVFEDVANSYDLMNDAMSLGIHRIWKDCFMEKLGPVAGTNLLDMAGGTGDIAFRYINYLKSAITKEQHVRNSQVTVGDINKHMLNVGKIRAEKLGLANLDHIEIKWKECNAEQLPFENNTFTAYTIAFGIRNCTHIDQVLAEAYRVLKPGGRFLCLEFSQLNNKKLQNLYDRYSFEIIPPMGQILAGQWQAYQYLVESIRKFPNQEDFKYMIKQAGFNLVTYENLLFGVTSIHSGFKL